MPPGSIGHGIATAASVHAEVDHDDPGLTPAVFDADALAAALLNLRQHGQRIVIVGKATTARSTHSRCNQLEALILLLLM